MSVNWDQVIWYSRSHGPVDAGPLVNVNKNGRIVLNRAAVELMGEQPEAFHVGLIQGNRGKVTLILQGAAKKEQGALTLSKQGTSKFSVNTTKFLTDLGQEKLFDTAEGKPEYDQERHALIVSL